MDINNNIIKIINENIKKENIPKNLIEIPSNFYNEAKEKGKLKDFYYNTYDSLNYEEKKTKILKKATVYIPYNYNKNNKYNVYYLMHGGWSNETTQLGSENNENSFKTVIDNMIQNKLINSLIICPTYNNLSNNDSSSYELSGYYLAPNFYRELIYDLMPKVKTEYATYAGKGTKDDLIKSREHMFRWIFNGFSLYFKCICICK